RARAAMASVAARSDLGRKWPAPVYFRRDRQGAQGVAVAAALRDWAAKRAHRQQLRAPVCGACDPPKWPPNGGASPALGTKRTALRRLRGAQRAMQPGKEPRHRRRYLPAAAEIAAGLPVAFM
ncbi:hypothetical protein IscW_ISCW004539, partial [Ixodes scapularis]